MVTESCLESRMRSRTSRGVPEWSGGEDLYMGSPISVAEKVSGVIIIVPGPPKGSRGPLGGATYPGGPHGLKWHGNQPLVGWCVPPKGPRCLGLETLGWGAHQPTWDWSPHTPGLHILLGLVAPPGGPPGPSRWSRYVTDSTRNFSCNQSRTSHI